MTEILTAAQMAAADKIAIKQGISELELIHNAGKAMAEEILKQIKAIRSTASKHPNNRDKHSNHGNNGNHSNIVVCCGKGNNGADGYVCATKLGLAGLPVQIISSVDADEISSEIKRVVNDAERIVSSIHYKPSEDKITEILSDALIVVDALIGSGLDKPPRSYIANIIKSINNSGSFIVAADIPSGISVDKADALDSVFVRADMTITFFRPKLAHYLYPAAAYCGKVICVPIGIADEVLDELHELDELHALKCRYQLNNNKLYQLPSYHQNGNKQENRGENRQENRQRNTGRNKAENKDSTKYSYKYNKYTRGSVLIVAGESLQGAAVLCATAAAASGVGLVSAYASQENAELMRQIMPPNIMVRSRGMAHSRDHTGEIGKISGGDHINGGDNMGKIGGIGGGDNTGKIGKIGGIGGGDQMSNSLEGVASRYKLTAALIGPGSGVNDTTAAQTIQLLNESIPVVLDADVFSSFASCPDLLWQATQQRAEIYKIPAVLTPHEGEFIRLFPHLSIHKSNKNKVERALQAAQESGAIVVLKGADTVIASPDGDAVINGNASPLLSVGGSGDVLGGIIVGLMAQGLAPKEAAYAGVMLHTKCADLRCAKSHHGFSPQDLVRVIPYAMAKLA